jgi:N,N-dimethylformamidase
MRDVALVGYTDRLSVAPGERLDVMVSCAAPRYRASLQRLATGGGGARAEVAVEAAFDGTYVGVMQPLRVGSHMEVVDVGERDLGLGVTFSVWVWPTTPADGRRVLMTRVDPSGHSLTLLLEDGLAVVEASDGSRVTCAEGLSPRSWHLVAATIDAGARRARVSVRSAAARPGVPPHMRFAEGAFAGALPSSAPASYVVAAEPASGETHEVCHHFNGKLEAPAVHGRPLDESELDRLADGHPPGEFADLLAAWDFASAIETRRVADISGNGLEARLVNMPTRGVTGHAFTGAEVDWRLAREQYAAAHFHDDDLDDANWDVAFSWQVPDDLRSGVYAIRLEAADDAEDIVPFVVRPSRGGPVADVAVVLPTFTYLAYANEHQLASEEIRTVFEGLGADFTYPFQPNDTYILKHRLASLYDKHADGSGVCYSSHLRPLMTMRPGYQYPYLRQGQGGPHGLPADLYLLAWLDLQGVAVDVLTDHDLHAEGVESLRRHRTVISGSHHEYWSAAMMAGLSAYLEDGGRFMCLSGNSLYWVTALDPERSHTIEIRRTEGSTRTWETLPGEGHLSMTGERGGLWRFRGQAPQRYIGVGFTAEGLGEGRPYDRGDNSDDPRVAFIFDGLGDDEAIGSFESPVLGHGAAGFEVDRFDAELGSPPHALVVATATGFSDGYQHVVEEVQHQDSQQGGTQSPFVRADMVFFETPNGGAVFSVGSIAWCASLLFAEGDNTVSRVTGNVLERFRDPEPFVFPGARPTSTQPDS